MSDTQRRWTLAVFAALTLGGFLLPFWPLCAAGIVALAVWGRWLIAIMLGLLLDVAWGPAPGLLHYLYLPFTALAASAALVRLIGSKYFINRAPPETL